MTDQDRYGVTELTAGELERARRDLTTGLGLTSEDSPLRISLASHLEAVTAELEERRVRHGEGKVIMATASPATGIREWQGTYAARPRQVRDARHAVGEFLAGRACADETLLICSELTTNAVLHSRSRDDGKLILRVTVYAEYVWIECEDAGGSWLMRPGDGRPHGLDVVCALCGEDGWGVEDLGSGRTGRVVWARAGTGPERRSPRPATTAARSPAGCPASHLASVISLMALNRLLHADDAPQTVGDVVRLCQDGKLTSGTFRYLGPRRRSEIEAGLVLAGFDISHRIRDGEAGHTQR